MPLDDAMDHGQAQTGALALVLGGKIGIENPVDDGGVDAGTGIGDGQAQDRSGWHIHGRRCLGGIEVTSSRETRNSPPCICMAW